MLACYDVGHIGMLLDVIETYISHVVLGYNSIYYSQS